MSEERRGRSITDPTELWRQWYETSTKMWSNVFEAGRENYLDPYGLYRQWFNGLEDLQRRMFESTNWPTLAASNGSLTATGSGAPATDPAAQNPAAAQNPVADAAAGQVAEVQNLWKQWFEATQDSWQKALGLGQEAVELTPRWIAMWDQIRNNLSSAEGFSTDPLQFATRWYNATSGPLSDFVGDLIEREEILDVSSQFMQSYASFYKVFRRNSEEYLKSLSIPVRSDIARVAGLVVALEDKMDRLEEDFEDFEYGYAEPATAESLQAVEDRIRRLESTLERIEGGAATADSVSGLENRLAATSESLASVKKSINELERILERIEGGAEGVATAESVGGLENRIGDVEGKVDRLLTANEERIDSLDRTLERIDEGAATADSVSGFEKRLDTVEGKLDQILVALENVSRDGGAPAGSSQEAEASQQAEASREDESVEIRATAAARRKARELGVDLSEIDGSGSGGQITVNDVRKKGAS